MLFMIWIISLIGVSFLTFIVGLILDLVYGRAEDRDVAALEPIMDLPLVCSDLEEGEAPRPEAKAAWTAALFRRSAYARYQPRWPRVESVLRQLLGHVSHRFDTRAFR
jgi:hypothetical protein